MIDIRNHDLDSDGPSHTISTKASSDPGGVLTFLNTKPGPAALSTSVQSSRSRSLAFASAIMPRSVALKTVRIGVSPAYFASL